MFSKAEATRLKQEFWTTFGKYISPVLSADGEKINWVNYHTGFRHLYFRMDADRRSATVSIEMTHPLIEERSEFFNRMQQLKKILEDTMGEEMSWEESYMDEFGKEMSRISISIEHVNVLDKKTWPELISFFKPRIIALDQFWSEAQFAFEDLR